VSKRKSETWADGERERERSWPWSVPLQHYQCFHALDIFTLILHIKYGSSIGKTEIFDLAFWNVADTGFDALLKDLQEWPPTAFTMQESIQQLNDLELAVLASLVAEEHCLFSTKVPSTLELRDELQAVCTYTFGLETASFTCDARTTVDDLNEALLVESHGDSDEMEGLHDNRSTAALGVGFSRIGRSSSPSPSNDLESRRIANVVIVADLDMADTGVQVQILELLRTGRVFTRTAMHTAPKDFLFIGIMSRTGSRLTHHLNDIFCMSHFHASEDGLPYTDGILERDVDPSLPNADVVTLREQARKARMTGEVASYLHNIVLFMRTSRYVTSGVTATATKQLRTLASALAPLHGLDYVPPSLVVLAARKIYPHRLVLATSSTEKSLQWGSDPSAVARLLENTTVEGVIEDVLASFESPL
jgi:hypothetical protein